MFNPVQPGRALSLSVTQNLLQGFRPRVNNRAIRVAKNQLRISDLTFQNQVMATVDNVVSLYWDLVSDIEALKVQQQTLELDARLYHDNQRRAELGAIAPIDVIQAEAEMKTRPAERHQRRNPGTAAGNHSQNRHHPRRPEPPGHHQRPHRPHGSFRRPGRRKPSSPSRTRSRRPSAARPDVEQSDARAAGRPHHHPGREGCHAAAAHRPGLGLQFNGLAGQVNPPYMRGLPATACTRA